MSAPKRRRTDDADDDPAILKDLAGLRYDQTAIDRLVQYHTQQMSATEAASAAASADDGSEPRCTAELYCCPRAYEDTFMREPVGIERACGRDQDCEGMQLQGTAGFVLREFIYPGQAPPDNRSLCLLCRRYEISRAYYKYETGHTAVQHGMRIADHYNLVGIPGEYDVRDCIVSGGKYTGLPLPVVLHVRSAYTCHMKDGVRHLSQSRMRCPGTGETTETGPFLMRRAALARQAARSVNSPLAELT